MPSYIVPKNQQKRSNKYSESQPATFCKHWIITMKFHFSLWIYLLHFWVNNWQHFKKVSLWKRPPRTQSPDTQKNESTIDICLVEHFFFLWIPMHVTVCKLYLPLYTILFYGPFLSIPLNKATAIAEPAVRNWLTDDFWSQGTHFSKNHPNPKKTHL